MHNGPANVLKVPPEPGGIIRMSATVVRMYMYGSARVAVTREHEDQINTHVGSSVV